MKTIKKWLLPYKQALPALLLYQIIATVASAAWLALFKWIAGLLIRGTGKVAISSGDFLFLFKTWQGYVIILLAILTLFLLVAIDINPLVILCGRILKGEKPNVLLCFKEGFVSLKRFFTPGGFVVVLYLSLLAPILGFGVSITLTQNLYIPKFITSVIYSTPMFLIPVIIVVALLLFLGVIYMFILHGTLLDGMKLKDSARNSVRLVKKNWKDFLKSIVVFLLLYAVVLGLLLGLLALVLWIRSLIPMAENVNLIVSLVLMLIILFPMLYIVALFMPNYVLKLTMLYNRYQSEDGWEYQKREPRKSPLVIANVVLVVLAIVGLTVVVATMGEELFPNEIKTGYIAHRAGGNEAPENTVAGVDAAYKLGASGAEIDIQRTSDGYYVVNHDADFARTCGVAKKPSEMTLAEVKELKVDGEPVATFEEMLDASHGRVILYVELKGETADQQMADDAVRIIKERGMEKETVLISLQYDLIDYISNTYPEMETGYLTFVSFGDTAALNCDYLALEEETSTHSMISSIHDKGKKVFVWTVNDDEDLYKFLSSDADEIITDNVSGAKATKALLEERSLFDRMVDDVTDLFFG
ncbi:glycerophosphodiester phosphodiesterase family protein [Ruminococcus sp.]|uniref:glycerophosphodiester phosphodiesterase family protein n=1 Tax=Ruminococcus sp. TaxID=41978 RepID=UPI003864C06F